MLYDKWIKGWKAALAENFFLRSAVLLLGAGLILNATLFRGETKVIVVPPTLQKEFWVDSSKASPEYLEQMGVFIATLIGNLSPRNSEYNIEVLLDYIDHNRLMEVKDDLKGQAQYIKKNNISQAYYPEQAAVDPRTQVTTIEGRVVRHIGDIKISEEKMRVVVGFSVKNHKLSISDLSVDYPGRKASEVKKDEEAAYPGTSTSATSERKKK